MASRLAVAIILEYTHLLLCYFKTLVVEVVQNLPEPLVVSRIALCVCHLPELVGTETRGEVDFVTAACRRRGTVLRNLINFIIENWLLFIMSIDVTNGAS